jgi:L-aspartate oxidase
VAEDLRQASPSTQAPRLADLRITAGFERGSSAAGDAALTAALRRLMWEHVGLIRNQAGLTTALDELDRLAGSYPEAAGEARNMLAVARLVTAAALERHESRGGHFRSDVPETDPAWARHLVLAAAADGSARFEETAAPALAGAAAR